MSHQKKYNFWVFFSKYFFNILDYVVFLPVLFHEFVSLSFILDVPWSFDGSNCHVKTALKHLVDDKIKCVQTIDEHDQFISDLQTKLKNVKILKYRKPLDTPSIIMKDFCISSTNDTEHCINIDLYHCLNTISLPTCKLWTNATSSPIADWGEDFIGDKLSIQIHHNFTNILNVTAFLVYNEFNSDSLSTNIVQKISLEYLEMNETFSTSDAHQVSGNIGYLQNKPIIVTKFIRSNESGGNHNVNQMGGYLAYFHNDTSCTNDDHYIKLPAIVANGDCVINNNTFQTINFGENARIRCNAVLTLTEYNETDRFEQPLNVEQNNTHICRAFQKKIFDYVLHCFELEDINSKIYNRFRNRISEMGNPRNETEYWHDLKTVQPPNLDEIVASSVANGTLEFTCTNMVLGVRYEFFYGTMMVESVMNQPSIKVSQIQFGNRVNLKFKLDDDILKVPIYIDVMFYDFSRVVGNGAQPNIKSHSIVFMLAIIILLNM